VRRRKEAGEAASLNPMDSGKIKNGHTATEVQLSQPIAATSEDIIKRYRENRHWRLYEKEWIYRNFPPARRTWLDFGCGTGEITTQLALLGADRVTAIDVTPGLIDMTQKQAEIDGVAEKVRTICGDITTTPPEPVDFVLAYAVLHHVPDRLQEITEAIVRWLKPGGAFIFCEPVCYIPMLEWARNHSAVAPDALDEGERKLTGSDLTLIESQFRDAKRVHFNTLRRLSRVIPSADRPLRSIDSALRIIPGLWHFAGNVIGVCRK
jgi:SAM-dependent methyltransferase